jgi:predicted PurR-regulated permease PerM
MKIIKKLLVIILFLIGLFLVLRIFVPEVESGIRKLVFSPELQAQANQGLSQIQDSLGKFLGKKSSSEATKVLGEWSSQSPEEVAQELLKDATAKVNQVINDKIEESKQIPKGKIDEVRKEIKQEIYKGLCENWLSAE